MTALVNFVPSTGWSGLSTDSFNFEFDVPPGCSYLIFTLTSGGVQTVFNAQMYARLGTVSGGYGDTSSWGTYSNTSGNGVILIPNPGAGTWHLLLQGNGGSWGPYDVTAAYNPQFVWNDVTSNAHWSATDSSTWSGTQWDSGGGGTIALQYSAPGAWPIAFAIVGTTPSSGELNLTLANSLHQPKMNLDSFVYQLPGTVLLNTVGAAAAGLPSISGTFKYMNLTGFNHITSIMRSATALADAMTPPPPPSYAIVQVDGPLRPAAFAPGISR